MHTGVCVVALANLTAACCLSKGASFRCGYDIWATRQNALPCHLHVVPCDLCDAFCGMQRLSLFGNLYLIYLSCVCILSDLPSFQGVYSLLCGRGIAFGSRKGSSFSDVCAVAFQRPLL